MIGIPAHNAECSYFLNSYLWCSIYSTTVIYLFSVKMSLFHAYWMRWLNGAGSKACNLSLLNFCASIQRSVFFVWLPPLFLWETYVWRFKMPLLVGIKRPMNIWKSQLKKLPQLYSTSCQRLDLPEQTLPTCLKQMSVFQITLETFCFIHLSSVHVL